jgi:hypothetical protein
MEHDLRETVASISAIGLDNPGVVNKLAAYRDDPVNHPTIEIYKEFYGQTIRFELNLDLDYHDNNRLTLRSYDLMLPCMYPPIEHRVNNGISTFDLEARMKTFDWSRHPGDFFDHSANTEWAQMDAVLTDLYAFRGDHDDEDRSKFFEICSLTDNLLAKYLTGSPLAEAIMVSVPYLRSSFYDLFPFPADFHASIPAKEAANRETLKALSESAWPQPQIDYQR